MKKLINIVIILSILVSVSLSAKDDVVKSVATLKADGTTELKVTEPSGLTTTIEVKGQEASSLIDKSTVDLIKRLGEEMKISQTSSTQSLKLNSDGSQELSITDANGKVVVLTANKNESINLKLMDFITNQPTFNTQPVKPEDNTTTKTATKPDSPIQK